MGRHSDDDDDDMVIAEAERAVRRVSLRSAWMPVLVGVTLGFLAALALTALLAFAWNPDGMGM